MTTFLNALTPWGPSFLSWRNWWASHSLSSWWSANFAFSMCDWIVCCEASNGKPKAYCIELPRPLFASSFRIVWPKRVTISTLGCPFYWRFSCSWSTTCSGWMSKSLSRRISGAMKKLNVRRQASIGKLRLYQNIWIRVHLTLNSNRFQYLCKMLADSS